MGKPLRFPDWATTAAPELIRYTQVPDVVFDVLMPKLTGAELKVLLYICRRTFGWHKDDDTISLSQLTDGITRHDGSVVDAGTGLSKSTVVAALKGLTEEGIVVAQRNASPERGHEPTTYRLQFRASPLSENRTSLPPEIEQALVRESNTQKITRQEGAAIRPDDWANVLQALAPQMKAAMYETYLVPLQPRVWTTERLELAAPAALFPVLPRFRPLIAKAVRATTQERPAITFAPRS